MTDNTAPKPVVVHVFGRTDVGRTREHNEDAFVVADLTADRATLLPEVRTHDVGAQGSLFMVADGMGGAAAGELASQMATEVVLGEMQKNWRSAPVHDAEGFANALKSAGETANAYIHDYAAKHPENRGMGSTATIAGILGDTVFLGQVGDSRGYLVRDGKAKQITRDQSLVQRLVEAGEITAEEAEMSDRRNIILQALGPEASVKIELTYQRVKRGDVLILCSDGLSGQVRTDEIGQVVAEEPDLMSVCKRLIDMANEAGGPDNITVIAVRFDGDALEAASGHDDIAHRVFQFTTDSRATVQVSAMPETTPTTPTLEVPVIGSNPPPPAPRLVPPPAPVPAAPAATPKPSSRAASVPAPTPRGPGVGTLRLVFIAVGVIVAGAFIVYWFRS